MTLLQEKNSRKQALTTNQIYLIVSTVKEKKAPLKQQLSLRTANFIITKKQPTNQQKKIINTKHMGPRGEASVQNTAVILSALMSNSSSCCLQEHPETGNTSLYISFLVADFQTGLLTNCDSKKMCWWSMKDWLVTRH